MKHSLSRHFARRRPLGIVIALCWLIFSPICQAQCVYPADSQAEPIVVAAVADDCHGGPKADSGSTTAACDLPHEPTHSGADRVDAPAPMVAELRLPAIHPLTPAVRVTARQDPAIQGQGPPLRLLTLRFIE